MPLVLVKEDGSLPVDANTYVDVDGLAAFAALRGVTIDPVAQHDPAAVALISAMDLIATYADRFVGVRCSAAQALDWPRTRYVDETVPGCPPLAGINPPGALPYAMPAALLTAQSFAALAAFGGTVLQPIVGTTGFLSVDKVGPLSQTYLRGVDYSNQPRIPTFAAAILTLCVRTSGLTVGRA